VSTRVTVAMSCHSVPCRDMAVRVLQRLSRSRDADSPAPVALGMARRARPCRPSRIVLDRVELEVGLLDAAQDLLGSVVLLLHDLLQRLDLVAVEELRREQKASPEGLAPSPCLVPLHRCGRIACRD
jgi:hypothetical protein